MQEFDNIEAMKIVKGPPKPKPKPKTVNVRFYDENKADLALLDKTVKDVNRSRPAGEKVSREELIRLVVSQALRDPKFVLKIP